MAGRVSQFFKKLGPGIITGASDDDPSGIATYSQAGAGFGMQLLWMAPFTFPMMAAIQGMCARIGMVTCEGLTHTLKKHYPRPILYGMLIFSVPAIILNISADIAGMGAVTSLLFPEVPSFVFSLVFTIVLMYMIIQFSYQKLAGILKWLCISILLYLLVPFVIKTDWGLVLRSTFIPQVHLTKDFVEMMVAILGTTISPYLFFWQVTMEAEDQNHKTKKIVVDKAMMGEMATDVNIGMFASNLVMLFIMITTGAVLFTAGKHDINTVDDAARALEPLAGKLSYLCFALGVIGTGMLAIPVLAGSLSYILAETFGWNEGLDKKFNEAKGFYIVVIISLLLGLLINLFGISPMKALIFTAIFYGLTAPVMIAVILHIGNNRKIMGEFTNKPHSNILGFLTLLLMTASAVMLIYFQFK
jgi:NRAMP (natural resistance-associated macrophage protein)-like metal ion transporter